MDPDDVLKDKSAPACVLVGLEVNGKDNDVRFGVIVMFVEDDGELLNRPEVTKD